MWYIWLALFGVIFLVYLLLDKRDETFYIPPSVVGSGDFHIEQPGAIADQGSFTDDMASYMEGQGPI